MAVLFMCAVLAMNPSFADAIYNEDAFFENFTVIVCAGALLFSLILIFMGMREKRVFWFFLSLFLIVFIGDEISWGMRVFGFTKHKIAGVGFDGLHDLLGIGIGAIKLVRDYIKSIGILDIRSIVIMLGSIASIGGAILLLINLFIKNKRRISEFFKKNLKWQPFFFLCIGLGLLIIAMYIDEDNLVSFPHKSAVEETMELMAGVSFLFAGLAGFRGRICKI